MSDNSTTMYRSIRYIAIFLIVSCVLPSLFAQDNLIENLEDSKTYCNNNVSISIVKNKDSVQFVHISSIQQIDSIIANGSRLVVIIRDENIVDYKYHKSFPINSKVSQYKETPDSMVNIIDSILIHIIEKTWFKADSLYRMSKFDEAIKYYDLLEYYSKVLNSSVFSFIQKYVVYNHMSKENLKRHYSLKSKENDFESMFLIYKAYRLNQFESDDQLTVEMMNYGPTSFIPENMIKWYYPYERIYNDKIPELLSNAFSKYKDFDTIIMFEEYR